MDTATKARYEKWKRKKISKYRVKACGILSIGVGLSIFFGLRSFNDEREDVMKYEYNFEENTLHSDYDIEENMKKMKDVKNNLSIATDQKRESAEVEAEQNLVMLAELEAFLNEQIDQTFGRIGLSYLCLTTGRQIKINADDLFFSASTIKLPTHMMIAESVQEGLLSWDQLLTVEQSDWLGGSGILQYHVNIDQKLTLYEVMRHSIVYSDNLAHRMLTRTLIPGFQHEYVGLDNSDWHLTTAVFNRFFGESPTGRMMISPNHLTEIFRVLYNNQDQIEGYRMILEQMMNTSWEDRFSTSLVEGLMAHTPGWTDPYHHDSGIFFTDRPYVLVIMTSGVADAPNFLSNISDLIFEFHLSR